MQNIFIDNIKSDAIHTYDGYGDERYLDDNRIEFDIAKSYCYLYNIPFDEPQSPSLTHLYIAEMKQHTETPITIQDFVARNFLFLRRKLNYFNGHHGPLSNESSFIIEPLMGLSELSNHKIGVITADSQPYAVCSDSEFGTYVQKPYIAIQCVSYDESEIKRVAKNINSKINSYPYIQAVANRSYELHQVFDKKTYYLSFMFGVQTPTVSTYDETFNTEWNKCFENVSKHWWNDVIELMKSSISIR